MLYTHTHTHACTLTYCSCILYLWHIVNSFGALSPSLPLSLSPLSLPLSLSSVGVAAVFGGVIKAGAVSVLLQIDEVGPLDASSTCFERSHYTFYDKDGKIFDHGK